MSRKATSRTEPATVGLVWVMASPFAGPWKAGSCTGDSGFGVMGLRV